MGLRPPDRDSTRRHDGTAVVEEARPLHDRRRIAVLRAIWAAFLATVITGTLMPGDLGPIQALESLHLSDKLEHFSSYAVLALIPALTERAPVRFAIAIGLVGLGILLEYLQLLTGRDFETADMLANTAGVAAGLLIGLAWPALRSRRARRQRGQ
jgi:VanZ family protein